ncbi:MAG: hypothetical protein NVV74_13325 [Magnetospirillum sp.]|nr:hypothetical protein [Magnetospirillum sp.]
MTTEQDVDYSAAAQRLWELLDREHDGNSVLKEEFEAREWGELSPEVRAMLCDVARRFLERERRQEARPRAQLPDFNRLAGEAMARADRYATVPQWVAETIATAYRLGRDSR